MVTQSTNSNTQNRRITPSPAAIGPTQRQLELQRQARERGGLTPSGLREYATGRSSPGGVRKTEEIVEEEKEFQEFLKSGQERTLARSQLSRRDQELVRKIEEARSGDIPKFQSESEVRRAIQLESELKGKGRTTFATSLEKAIQRDIKAGRSRKSVLEDLKDIKRDEATFEKPVKDIFLVKMTKEKSEINKQKKNNLPFLAYATPKDKTIDYGVNFDGKPKNVNKLVVEKVGPIKKLIRKIEGKAQQGKFGTGIQQYLGQTASAKGLKGETIRTSQGSAIKLATSLTISSLTGAAASKLIIASPKIAAALSGKIGKGIKAVYVGGIPFRLKQTGGRADKILVEFAPDLGFIGGAKAAGKLIQGKPNKAELNLQKKYLGKIYEKRMPDKNILNNALNKIRNVNDKQKLLLSLAKTISYNTGKPITKITRLKGIEIEKVAKPGISKAKIIKTKRKIITTELKVTKTPPKAKKELVLSGTTLKASVKGNKAKLIKSKALYRAKIIKGKIKIIGRILKRSASNLKKLKDISQKDKNIEVVKKILKTKGKVNIPKDSLVKEKTILRVSKAKLKPKKKIKIKVKKLKKETPKKFITVKEFQKKLGRPTFRTAKFRRKQFRKEILRKLNNQLKNKKTVKFKGRKQSRKEFRKLILKKTDIPQSLSQKVDKAIYDARIKKFPRTTPTKQKKEFRSELKELRQSIQRIDNEIKSSINNIKKTNNLEKTFSNQLSNNIESSKIKSLENDRKEVLKEIGNLMAKNNKFLTRKEQLKLIKSKAGKIQDFETTLANLNKKAIQNYEKSKKEALKDISDIALERFKSLQKAKKVIGKKFNKGKIAIGIKGQVTILKKKPIIKKPIKKPSKGPITKVEQLLSQGQKLVLIPKIKTTKKTELPKINLKTAKPDPEIKKIVSKANKIIEKGKVETTIIQSNKQKLNIIVKPKTDITQKLRQELIQKQESKIDQQQKQKREQIINQVQKIQQKQTVEQVQRALQDIKQKIEQQIKFINKQPVTQRKKLISKIKTPLIRITIPPEIIKTNIPFYPKDDELNKLLKKLKKKQKKSYVFEYTPTLGGLGLKSGVTTGRFTGFEVRGSVIKPIKVKRHKRKTLKNKLFVRKHRRRKPQ